MLGSLQSSFHFPGGAATGVPAPIEERLKQSEAQMKEVIGKERELMEERLAQSLIREQRHNLDKGITVK